MSFLKEYFDDLEEKDFRKLAVVTLEILKDIDKKHEEGDKVEKVQ